MHCEHSSTPTWATVLAVSRERHEDAAQSLATSNSGHMAIPGLPRIQVQFALLMLPFFTQKHAQNAHAANEHATSAHAANAHATTAQAIHATLGGMLKQQTYEELKAGGQGVGADPPPPRFIPQCADQLACPHQPLLTQAVLLLQGRQLCLGTRQLLLQGLYLVDYLPVQAASMSHRCSLYNRLKEPAERYNSLCGRRCWSSSMLTQQRASALGTC